MSDSALFSPISLITDIVVSAHLWLWRTPYPLLYYSWMESRVLFYRLRNRPLLSEIEKKTWTLLYRRSWHVLRNPRKAGFSSPAGVDVSPLLQLQRRNNFSVRWQLNDCMGMSLLNYEKTVSVWVLKLQLACVVELLRKTYYTAWGWHRAWACRKHLCSAIK